MTDDAKPATDERIETIRNWRFADDSEVPALIARIDAEKEARELAEMKLANMERRELDPEKADLVLKNADHLLRIAELEGVLAKESWRAEDLINAQALGKIANAVDKTFELALKEPHEVADATVERIAELEAEVEEKNKGLLEADRIMRDMLTRLAELKDDVEECRKNHPTAHAARERVRELEKENTRLEGEVEDWSSQ